MKMQPPHAMKGSECVSELVLDRAVAGERLTSEVHGHLAGCGRCSARLAARTREQADFAGRSDLEVLAGRALRARAPRPGAAEKILERVRSALLWPRVAAVPLAVAALGLALLVPGGSQLPSEPRAKGGAPILTVLRKTPTRAAPITPSDALHPGDRLQFWVTTAEPGFFAVFGVDARGSVWQGAPVDGADMIALPAGRDQPLPGAVELDAEGARETVTLFACSVNRPLASLREARAGGEVPEGCTATSLTFEKAQR